MSWDDMVMLFTLCPLEGLEVCTSFVAETTLGNPRVLARSWKAESQDTLQSAPMRGLGFRA